MAKSRKGRNATSDLNPKDSSVPPDGGWGWWVVLSSFLSYFIFDGISYSMGLMLREVRAYFGSSHQTMGLLASVVMFCAFGTSAVDAALTTRWGCRAVGICGGLLFGSGMILSSLAPNMKFLFFSSGLIAGWGLGLSSMASVVIVTQYFSKRLSFATGLAVAGAGVGTFIFAPLVRVLLDVYGWRGAYLILGGLALNCCMCAMLYRPLSARKGDTEGAKEKQDMDTEPASINCRDLAMECPAGGEDVSEKENMGDNPEPLKEHTGFLHRVSHPLKQTFAVLKKKAILARVIGEMLAGFAEAVVYTFLPDMAIDAGIGSTETAFLISIVGIFSTFSRMALGWFSDRTFVNRPIMFAANVSVIAVSIAVFPFCATNYIILTCNAALYGTCTGYRIAQFSVVLAELVGVQDMPTAFGLLCTSLSVTCLFGPSLVGYMYDVTGAYTLPFLVMGGIMLMSSVFNWLVLLTPEYKDSRVRLQTARIQEKHI